MRRKTHVRFWNGGGRSDASSHRNKFIQPDSAVQLQFGSSRTIESLGDDARAWQEGKWDDIVVPNPQFLNRYAYVANNPLRARDPDGHFAWFLIPVIGGLIGGVANAAPVLLSNPGGSDKVSKLPIAFGKGFGAGSVGTLAGLAGGAVAIALGATEAIAEVIGGASSGLMANTLLNGMNREPLGDNWALVTGTGGILGVAGRSLAILEADAMLAGKPYLRQTGVGAVIWRKHTTLEDLVSIKGEAWQDWLSTLSGTILIEARLHRIQPSTPTNVRSKLTSPDFNSGPGW